MKPAKGLKAKDGPRRLKVALVITRLDLGGAQQVALETARGLDPARFEVTLIAGLGGALDAQAARELGPGLRLLPRLKHPISPFNDLIAFFQLLFFFYRSRIDVVHTHSSKAGLLGRLAAFCAGVPAIVHTVHGWSFHDFMKNPGRAFYIGLERFLARLSTRLFVVAESCRLKGLMNGIGSESSYELLRAAVDLPQWQRQKPAKGALARAGLRMKKGDLVVGCIANLKEQKNPLDFVRVAAAVLKDFARARFAYIGDGPLKPEALALAKSLGIKERVHFLGWQKDPLALAAGFDLFLLTSLWEGLPCVFPQALALGLPVVASNVDGAAEVVKEGLNGFLCLPKDIESLADRVLLLLKNPSLRRRMAAAARRSVGPEFGYAGMLARTQMLYQTALA